MITIDSLGEKGEQRFGELCADAGLFCSKTTRDRVGWDFFVDFPHGVGQTGPLDQRIAPMSCYVQVKTVKDTSQRASLKLNMAGRLAAEPKPSFICLFKVNESLQFTDVYLIHVSDDRLGQILKRLRSETAKGNETALNKNQITFIPNEGERIELSGTALRAAFQRHCGDDIAAYVKCKAMQHEKLGFDDKRYAISVDFAGIDVRALRDAFFGLTSKIEVEHLEVSQTRFGISLPESTAGPAAITIQPHPSDTCLVSYSSAELEAPAVFAADVYRAPKMGGGTPVLFKAELFSIIVTQQEDRQFVEFKSFPQGKHCEPSMWADFWRLQAGFYSETGTVEILTKSRVVATTFPAFAADVENRQERLAEALQLVHLFDSLSRLLKRAGVLPMPKVDGDTVLRVWDAIVALTAMTDGKQSELTLSDEAVADITERGIARGIVAGRMDIDTITLAFYGVFRVALTPSGEGGIVKAVDFKVKRLRAVDQSETGFDSFVELARQTEEISDVLYV